MKKTSFVIKIMSMVLAITIILEILPMSVWAEEYNERQAIQNVELATSDSKSPIVGEITSERTENKKVYEREDGSYTAIITSGPIHYNENGEWKDIDNTLTQKDGKIENKANSFNVDLPSKITPSSEVLISKGESSLSFKLNNTNEAQAEIKNTDTKSVSEMLPNTEKIESAVEYKNVFDNTNIKYDVGAEGLKESIIISSSPSASVTYSYTLNLNECSAVKNNDGSISVSRNGQPVFLIEKPYMFDSKDAISEEITVELTSKGEGAYLLEYTPSYEWLNASSREYPVTIDPSTTIHNTAAVVGTLIGSCSASQNDLNTNFFIEKNSNYDSKVYLKYTEAAQNTLGENSLITKAELSVYGKALNNSDTLAVYALNGSWDASTTNPVAKDNEILDYNVINVTNDLQRYVWDITEVACQWQMHQKANNGVVIEPLDDNDCNTMFRKTHINSNSSVRPWFEIDYVKIENPSEYDNEEVEMGRAGTLYLNKYTGTFYVNRNDIGLEGNISPVSISYTYNPWDTNRYPLTSAFGANWFSDYFGCIQYKNTIVVDNETRHQYLLWSQSGISTMLREVLPTDDDYNDVPDGMTASYLTDYTRYAPINGDTSKCLWVPKTDTTYIDYANMKLEDQEHIYTIDSARRITKIINKNSDTSNPNEIAFGFLGTGSHTFSNVTDGVGRRYNFKTYTESNNKVMIDKLNVYNSSNSVISVSVGGNNIPVGADYSYQVNDSTSCFLTGVDYPDGESVSYEYNSDGLLCAMTDIDGSRLELTYSNGRVTGYTKYAYYVSANSSQNCPEIKMETTFDSARQRTYTYYTYGSTTPETIMRQRYDSTLAETDYYSLDGKFSYTKEIGNTTSISKDDNEAQNLITNGNFDNSSDWTMIPSGSVSAAQVTNTNAFSETDQDVCRMTNGSNGTNMRASQTISSLPANTGEKVYTVCAWAKSENACANEYVHNHNFVSKTFALCVLDSSDNVLAQYDFDTECDEWQFGAVSFRVDTAMTNAKVVLAFDNQSSSSTAIFDCVKLYETDNSSVQGEQPTMHTNNTPSNTVEINNITYRRKPCLICSCAQCTTPITVQIEGVDTKVYYNCSCDSDDENVVCDCLGCRQATSKRTIKNSYGLTTQEKQEYEGKTMSTTYNYTSNCNYLASATTDDGITVYYNYNADTGFLESFGAEKDVNNNILNPVVYSYNAVGKLISAQQTVTDLANPNNTQNHTTDYGYTHGKLTSVANGNSNYTFDYDVYGNATGAKINGNTIISYTYPDHHNVGTITYANGLVISYTYDSDDNITQIKMNNVLKYAYEYTDGVLSKSLDYANMIVTYYSNEDVVMKRFTVENGLPVDGDTIYEYNHEDCTESLFGAECTYHEGTQTYNSSDDTVTSTHSVNYDNYSFLYEETVDFFNRTVGKVTSFTNYQNETTSLSSEITYADTATAATTRATGIENKVDGQTISNFTYTYDDSGRITEVRAGGVLRYKYVYDESGQVALDYNFTDNTATKYVYDANGNILQKTPYTNVTTTDLSTATQGTAISYTYDSNWGDKLVSYNSQSIVYDSIGNPTTYRGATLTWTGRMLTSFEKMSGDKLQKYEYSYDKDGYRTTKKYYEDGILQTETVYMWKDGKLVGSNVSDDSGTTIFTIKYIYNGEELVAINLNGGVLLVEKNLQGDITSLYDVDNNEKLFDFYYDAYGNVSFSQENSFIVTVIKALVVVLASVAYRGYYYDFDTGLYYLQSRYYDPQTGRFISLDDTQIAITTVGEPLGSNLYAYCYNNPVYYSDPNGYDPRTVSGSAYGYKYSGYFTALSTPKDIKKAYIFNVSVNNKSIFCNFYLKTDYYYGCIELFNKQDNISYIYEHHMAKTLAYSLICLSKKVKYNSLQTRTVEGIAFELVCHYVAYKFLILRKKAEPCDCGHTKTDSNAAFFEKHKNLLNRVENAIQKKDYNGALSIIQPLRSNLKW